MNKKGFTLVEILVVLVVIGTLVALLIPNAMKAIEVANVRSCANNIRTINSAISLCYADQSRIWTNCDTLAELCPFLPSEACANGASVMTCPYKGTKYLDTDLLTDANTGAISFDKSKHFTTYPDTHL